MPTQVAMRWTGYRGPSGRFAAQAQGALDSTLAQLGESLLALARREAPVGQPGSYPPGQSAAGRLRSELRVRQERSGMVGTLVLDSPTPYARWVLEGRPEIVPVSRRFLRFWVQGHLVFAKRVAGVAPNPFLERAFAEWWPTAQGPIQQLAARATALLLEE
jgi:hypothetical protein